MMARRSGATVGSGLIALLCACAVGRISSAQPARRRHLRQRPHAGRHRVGRDPGRRRAALRGRMDIPSQWWTLFKECVPQPVGERALRGNPDVGAAQAALRQAHELYLAQWTSFFPVVQGGFNGTRAKNAVGSIANPTNLPQSNRITTSIRTSSP